MPSSHAVLSASSSDRWIHCPPSARLCENYDDVSSEFAAEGTDAHTLCEYRLKTALGEKLENPIDNLTWYNEEMDECAQSYAEYILELVNVAKTNDSTPTVLIEQRVDFSRWVKEGFGTADCLVISNKTLNVVDYKHGKGVEVSAERNSQMMLYALGALEIIDYIYDIDEVQMTIFQPRKNNVSVFKMHKDELLEWADSVLVHKAELAFDGQGDFSCGEWCRFCKAKAECRERANANLEMVKYEFQEPVLLTDEEIAEILSKVDMLSAWVSDIKEYALQQAISGKEWPGWKLVEGRSNRKYTNDAAVAVVVEKAGFDPYEKKVVGITAMQKMLGKSRFEELLSSFVEKPRGKPALVPNTDNRPAINTAKNDFMEE